MSTTLTQGAVRQMVEQQQKSDSFFQPTLQVINVKGVGNNNSRYRVILSDGVHFVQGMLSSQLNQYVHNKQMDNLCILQLQDFMANEVQGHKVIILLKVQFLSGPTAKIGNPVDVAKAASGPMVTPPETAKPLYNSTNNTGMSTNNAAASSYGSTKTHTAASSSNPYGGAPSSLGSHGSANPYGRSSQSPIKSQQAPIVRSNAMTASAEHFTPIASLNMYANRWTIKARVTNKSDIRTWSNAKGEGSLFSVEFLDASGVDIRATFFREAVDKFYGMLEEGKVYRVSGGRLKVANMQYNNCKSSYELTMDQNAEIHLDNDAGEIKQQVFEFVKIGQLEAMEPGKIVDILAVVKSVSQPAKIESKKSGRVLTKCELSVVDDSGVEISLTLWGDENAAKSTELASQPIVGFRRVKVSDFGGKSLSLVGSIHVHPDVPEASQLQAWWQANGGNAAAVRSLSRPGGGTRGMAPLSERKDIASIKAEQMGMQPDKQDYVSFKATVSFIKKDKDGGAWYPACPNADEPCRNRFKVTQATDGRWQCDRCTGTYDNCVRRWLFSGVLEDETSSTWVTFYNEAAETLLGGVTADEVYQKASFGNEGGQDQDAYDSFFVPATHSEWIFTCRVKNEMVNEEARVKTSVQSIHPVDYVKESQDLIAAIQAL